MSPIRSFVASAVAVGAFAGMVHGTTSVALKIGPPPDNLSKFEDGMHGLVELLGGTEASPFVWGPFLVNHELPQLMPNVQLVKSRDRWTREVDHPSYHAIVEHVFNGFREGRVNDRAFQVFTQLYPIDHIVISYRYKNAKDSAAFLNRTGWRVFGRSGQYEVYRKVDDASQMNDAQ